MLGGVDSWICQHMLAQLFNLVVCTTMISIFSVQGLLVRHSFFYFAPCRRCIFLIQISSFWSFFVVLLFGVLVVCWLLKAICSLSCQFNAFAKFLSPIKQRHKCRFNSPAWYGCSPCPPMHQCCTANSVNVLCLDSVLDKRLWWSHDT